MYVYLYVHKCTQYSTNILYNIYISIYIYITYIMQTKTFILDAIYCLTALLLI